MKKPIILVAALALMQFFACTKDAVTPAAEDYTVYESTMVVTDRAPVSKTASVTWSSTGGKLDAIFEVYDMSTSPATLKYTSPSPWINSSGGSVTTPSFSVESGATIKLVLKCRKAAGVPAGTTPILTYTFNSTCGMVGCACGSIGITNPNWAPFSAIPGQAYTTQACL